jgi:hypothetical protein
MISTNPTTKCSEEPIMQAPTKGLAPRFFAAMPADKPGRWVAVVIRTSHFREPREVWTREVSGFRLAYIVARLAALWDDFCTAR